MKPLRIVGSQASAERGQLQGPRRALHGFGQAVGSAAMYAEPESVAELKELLARALQARVPVAMRGAGRSYGDAALGGGGVVIGTSRLNRILSWDPATGILEAEPGVTIEDIWRRTLPDGYWSYVVPGTMFPTLGGCVAANIHGKNHFAVGPIGDHVLELDLLTPGGELLTCNREQHGDVFRAVIGGFGALGVTTRIRLELKKIESGNVRVEAWTVPNLDALFDAFEERLPQSDYLVGWVDCFPGGKSLGRAAIHQANYLTADQDPKAAESFDLSKQDLPSRLFGVLPKSVMWRLMKPFANDLGTRFVNFGKYFSSVLLDRKGKTYDQSLVAFQFLLDYIPRWRDMYGLGGFIQVQPFVPAEHARSAFRRILELCHTRGVIPYLGVFKRHRPDEYLISHAVDGYSLAMDFKVTPATRERVWAVGQEIADIVVETGGRFYFAKDAVVRADQVRAAFGDRLDEFVALKKRLDPEGLLSTELLRRAIPELPVIS